MNSTELATHFMGALIVVLAIMVGVLVMAYQAQYSDPNSVANVCEHRILSPDNGQWINRVDWDCSGEVTE